MVNQDAVRFQSANFTDSRFKPIRSDSQKGLSYVELGGCFALRTYPEINDGRVRFYAKQ